MAKQREDRFYDPSEKRQREMLKIINDGLRKTGIKSGYMVRGALRPTLEVNVPKRKRRDGGVDYITYDIQVA